MKYSILFSFLAFATTLQAQALIRTVLPAAGSSSNPLLTWTLSEVSTERYTAGGYTLWQGFQVPDAAVASGGLVLASKMYLLGVFDQNSALMKDELRQLSLLPIVQPYTAALGYTHIGTESVAASVFVTTGSNAIVDWVLVELRDKANTGQTLISRAALLQRDGDIVDVDGLSPLVFTGAPPDDYYVVVRHRNHLGVSTKTPVAIGSVPLVLDFTDGSVATFGTNAQASLGGKLLLWSGDANGEGKVIYAGSGTDVNAVSAKVFTNPLNTTFSPSFPFLGYDRADLNLDGKVVYAGAGTDVNFISLSVFTFPANVGLSPTYVLLGQLP